MTTIRDSAICDLLVISDSPRIHLVTALALTPGQPHTSGRRPRPLTAGQLGLPAKPRTMDRKAGLTAHVRATVDAGVRVLLEIGRAHV